MVRSLDGSAPALTLGALIHAADSGMHPLRAHQALILNRFAATKQFSSGIVEDLNYKIELTFREAYGYGTLEVAETVIDHALVDSPEPTLTHEFW